jgi:hypothetical protein
VTPAAPLRELPLPGNRKAKRSPPPAVALALKN